MRGTRHQGLALVLALALAAPAAGEGVKPLRGDTPVPDTTVPDSYRTEKHDRPLPRSFKWQPPIIPHNVKGYQITKNVNTCLTCHSAKASRDSGATPVGKSHYLDRDGKELMTVSTRRYFCLQCHVPQYDAPPLVGNGFKS